MALIQNGSGLWIPEDITRQTFSVPDGTGYIRGAARCFHSGFASADDRIIRAQAPGLWNVSGPGYWTKPPTAVDNVSANATVSAWMTGTDIGDQWCSSAITNLVEAGGTGAGIGVMCRVQQSGGSAGHGYYAMIAKFGGVYRYETGLFLGTVTAKAVAPSGTGGLITLLVTGTTVGGGTITVTMYAGKPPDLTFIASWTDSHFNTGVPGAIASSGSNGHPDTFEDQTGWVAAEIGGC